MKLVAIALLVSLPVAGSAAPLCRDGKGLFTPCTPAETMRRRDAASHRRPPVEPSAPAAGVAVASDMPRASEPRHDARRERRPAIATGRLCRDGKGLFTPCPQ
jgi:hypothetical protein